MTLDSAIKGLYDIAYSGVATNNQKSQDALKLGIEALKSIKINREIGVLRSDLLLPFETKK